MRQDRRRCLALFVTLLVVSLAAEPLTAQPANDDCLDAVEIFLNTAQAYDTSTATGDIHGLQCQVHRDVWFYVHVPSSGVLTTLIVNGAGNPTDIAHAVYVPPAVGCPTNGSLRACLQLPGGDESGVAVDAGEVVYIRVGGWHPSAAPRGDIRVTLQTPVAHDQCTAPQPISVPGSVSFDTLLATPSASALACGRFQSLFNGEHFDDLWFSVTPPTEGALHVVVASSQAALAIYEQLQPGVCPGPGDLLRCAPSNEAYAHVFPGQTYLIRVSKSWSGALNSTISVALGPLLPNDNCDTAEVLTLPAAITFDASTAFDSALTGGCDVAQDLWYEVTPTVSGLLTIQVGGVSNLVGHAVYELPNGAGTCPPGAPLTCVTGVQPWDSVTPVIAGNSYALQVGRWALSSTAPGPGTPLVVAVEQRPANDDCAAGATQLIPSVPATLAWDNLTAQDDLAGLSCLVPRRDLWYRFVPPQTGTVKVSVSGATLGQTSPSATAFAIYEDPSGGTLCPSDGDLIVCTEFDPDATVDVVAGASYLIRLGSDFAGIRLQGALTVGYVLGAPRNVVCDASTPGALIVSYEIPPGNSYDQGVDVIIDEVQVATLPQTQLSYVHPLAPGFVGVIDVVLRANSSLFATSDDGMCSAAIGGPANNTCASALPILLGPQAFDNTITTLDPAVPLPICGPLPGRDLWFELVTPLAGPYVAETCGTGPRAFIEIWDAALGCAALASPSIACDDQGCLDGSRASWSASAGASYFVRLGGLDDSTGAGVLTTDFYCAEVSDFTCDFDCFLQEANFSWAADVTHFDYLLHSDVDGALGMTAAQSFSTQVLSPGIHTITLTALCPNGVSATTTCELTIIDLGAAVQDVVIALEGVGSNDSVQALTAALQGEGRALTLVGTDFGDHLCLDSLTLAAEVVWVLAGTHPAAYSLSAHERDAVALFASNGAAVYLEGADLWGFDHIPSQLDAIDGIEHTAVQDGDDLFDGAQGVDSGLPGGDFAALGLVGYQQDQPADDDSTDQLYIGVGDPGITSGAVFLAATAPGYPVGVLATDQASGGRMLSMSWEFGGAIGAGVQTALVREYLTTFGVGHKASFVRGDVVGLDGTVNIADAVALLSFIFPQGAPGLLLCEDAADADASGGINLADPVVILGSLFGAAPSPLPFPNMNDGCGSAEQLGCADYPGCP